MKPIVCVYCEGTDIKLAVFSKEQDQIKILKTVSTSEIASSSGSAESGGGIPDLGGDDLGGDISFEEFGGAGAVDESGDDVGYVAGALKGIKLSKANFIPIVTEPVANFHLFEGDKNQDKNKLVEAIIADIQEAKGFVVDPSSIDFVELNEKSLLSVFLEGEVPGVNFINALAGLNHRRFYKIPSIKTADLSLSYYISKTTKFFPEDYSLIIYIGKEYSKLIFLEGQKLKHLGTTLDIGTNNLSTYDVYFSKILLEMENGGIPKLDNIILCGEDRSENLLLSFYGTFPEANVTELKFDNIDTSGLEEEEVNKLSAFSIPISVALEFYDEQNKTYSGINILPKEVQERQKVFQFAWHAYILIPLIFFAAFYFTNDILSNSSEIDRLDKEINDLTQRQIQNQAIVDQMTPLTEKINNFDFTQSILDSAASGSEVWGNALDDISTFIERRRNFWITKLETISAKEIQITGYSLSRSVLTEFAEEKSASILKNILYEPLREQNTFIYTLNFNIGDK